MPKVADLAVEVGADITPLTTDMKAAGHSVDRFTKSAERFSRRTERSFQRINRSSGRLRAGVQNTAFQFQDLAVQIAGGTAASRALAQQMPQLLGGFGALGAVLGAVVAVAIPLRTAMQGMAADGEDVTKAFGTLEPLAKATANAFQNLGQNVHDALELAVNNIDRIIVVAGTATALFAGRWVAAMVAARVATFSLSGALVALRGALIRTGIGALVVGAGELVFQFTRLAKSAGGFGAAVGLLWDVAKESFGRIGVGMKLLQVNFQIISNGIADAWNEALGTMSVAFGRFQDSIAESGLGQFFGLQGGFENAAAGAVHQTRSQLNSEFEGLLGERGALEEQLAAPLDSIQRIRDLMASIKEEKITLPDLFGVSEEEDEDGNKGSDRLKEKLSEREQAIADHMNRIRALTQGGLGSTLGAWGKYFGSLATLTDTNNKKLLGVAKSFGAAQALIDAWRAHNATLADPTLPWWARIASAVQVLGAGLGAVSAISSVSSGGGGATASPAGGGASFSAISTASSAPETSDARVVNLQLIGGIPREYAIQMVDALNDAIGDGARINLV